MSSIIEMKGISKAFAKQTCLKDISFTLKSGECLGVLGDNGSGKSTLMSILSGMLNADCGDILFNDHLITKDDRQKVGYVPQAPILIEYLTVKDNLKLWHSLYNLKDFKQMLLNIPEFLNINQMLHKKVYALSGGMKKKLSIAISLMNDPEFLILDEAFAALDSKTVSDLTTYLNDIKDIGIVYSSHNINEIIEICNRVIVLKDGAVAYCSEGNQNYDSESLTFLYSKF